MHVSREHDRICSNRNATSVFFFSRDKAKQDFCFVCFFFLLLFVFAFDRTHQHFYHISLAFIYIRCGICLLCRILISTHQARASAKTKFILKFFMTIFNDDDGNRDFLLGPKNRMYAKRPKRRPKSTSSTPVRREFI